MLAALSRLTSVVRSLAPRGGVSAADHIVRAGDVEDAPDVPRLLDLRGLGCERETPSALLWQLRQIDPLAELIDAGRGRWWLGVVKTPVTPERRRAAYDALQRANGSFTHDGDGVLQARLMRQGFSLIAEHTIHGEPDARIVRDFEIRQYRWLRDPDAAFLESLDVAEGGPRARARLATLQDVASRGAEGAYAYRKAVKHAVYSRPYFNAFNARRAAPARSMA